MVYLNLAINSYSQIHFEKDCVFWVNIRNNMEQHVFSVYHMSCILLNIS